MSAFETDPTGDIHKPVAANRYLVQAIKASMAKTADEFLSDLYECLVASYLRRDIPNMLETMKLIANARGWDNGGLESQLSAPPGVETPPSQPS